MFLSGFSLLEQASGRDQLELAIHLPRAVHRISSNQIHFLFQVCELFKASDYSSLILQLCKSEILQAYRLVFVRFDHFT